jgi:hypothetical protein
VCPRLSSLEIRVEPIPPVAPVTKTCIVAEECLVVTVKVVFSK